MILYHYFEGDIHPSTPYFPATDNAPATKTRFFKMYCPSNDGQKGKASKQVSGKINIGKKVPIMCNKSKMTVYGTKRFTSKPRPMATIRIPLGWVFPRYDLKNIAHQATTTITLSFCTGLWPKRYCRCVVVAWCAIKIS